MKCLIICSSKDIVSDDFSDIDLSECFIICADGGFEAANRLGIKPDLWVGDMDSLNSDKNLCAEKIIFPVDKDMTDSHIAVNEAIKRGFKEILLVGATGGRLDHEYANYCLLKYILKSGGNGMIINKNNRIILTDKNIEIMPCGMKYISFFPFSGKVNNFFVKDVKYELEKYCLTDDDTFTTSNEFCGDNSAKVSFKDGYVLIITSKDF